MKWKKDNSTGRKNTSSAGDDDEAVISDNNRCGTPSGDASDFTGQTSTEEVSDDKPDDGGDYNPLKLSLQVSEPLDKLASLSKSVSSIPNIIDTRLQPIPTPTY